MQITNNGQMSLGGDAVCFTLLYTKANIIYIGLIHNLNIQNIFCVTIIKVSTM